MVEIKIDKEKCSGCGACIDICPATLYCLDNETKKAVFIDSNDCFECKACEIQCKNNAITVNVYV